MISRILLLCVLVSSAAFARTPEKPSEAVQRSAAALPSLAPLVDAVKSAVVNVDVQAEARRPGGPGMDEYWGRLFGGPQQEKRIRQGMGSGFIVDGGGTVLTNNHVIEGAVRVRVRLDDGRAFEAQVVGRDPLTDVAVLKLKGVKASLPFVRLGDSDAVRVGDWTMAIGNPFGLASSVSLGILSARARDIQAGPYDDFLQTDAAINPGNSGGPLFNLKGEVIGMNTAIVGGGTGIGFAVPSNLLKALRPQLEQKGKVTRGWLGIGIQDLNDDLARALKVDASGGAIVSEFLGDRSPAQKGGLKIDDVIISLDGKALESGKDLSRRLALKRPGSMARLEVVRKGRTMRLRVKLGTRPDDARIGMRGPQDREEDMEPGRLGLAFTDPDPRVVERLGTSGGALITQVQPASPAENAGLAAGMVIVEVDGKSVKNRSQLYRSLKRAKSGQTLLLRVAVPTGGAFLRALTIP